jgi:hypothetical protein
MNSFQNIKKIMTPLPALRFGLGMVFLYAGTYMAIDRIGWMKFIPNWINFLPKETLVVIAGIFCVVLAIGFFAGLFLRIISFLSFFYFFGILVFYGANDVTFHDFGLMMMSLAVFLLSQKEKSA